jgi:anti-anti-sigma factor
MANSNLNITVEQIHSHTPVTIFHLEGKLDPNTTDKLEQAAQEALEQGTRCLLLDFKGITLVTSAGLRVILSIYKMLTPKDTTAAMMKPPSEEHYKSPYFKLANLTPDVYYVFNISGFTSHIAIYPDTESALKAFA